MSGTKSLPEDEATGVAAKRTPFASNCASTKDPIRLRSHEAARGRELAAGLYLA